MELLRLKLFSIITHPQSIKQNRAAEFGTLEELLRLQTGLQNRLNKTAERRRQTRTHTHADELL